jgi:hypothetical protein
MWHTDRAQRGERPRERNVLRQQRHTGNIQIERSVITNNTGGSWYPTYPQISNHDDTPIEVIGDGLGFGALGRRACVQPLRREPLGEAIGFSSTGYVTLSEGFGQPLIGVERTMSTPADAQKPASRLGRHGLASEPL